MQLKEALENFFREYNDVFDTESVVILRHDGIVLHSIVNNQNHDSTTIGVLTSGLWQAAMSLGLESKKEFRLSFDTTDSGVFILPIKINNEDLYMCSLFEGLRNPALFKRNMQVIVDKLKKYLKQNVTVNKKINKKERQDYLFSDISDHEMDALFNFN